MKYVLQKSTVCQGQIRPAGSIVDVDACEAGKLFAGGAINSVDISHTVTSRAREFCWEIGGEKTRIPQMIDSCWLVCSGKSITDIAGTINQSLTATVCVNNAVRAVHADFFVATDVMPRHRDKFPSEAIYGAKCFKIFPRHCWIGEVAPQMTALVDADFIELNPDSWLSNGRFSPGGYWKLRREYQPGTLHSASTLFLAFQACIAMGAKRIALAGCDLEYNKGEPEYFYDDGRVIDDIYLARKQEQIKFFNQFFIDSSNAFNAAGVEVKNVTEGGNMNAFERMNVNDAQQWLLGAV